MMNYCRLRSGFRVRSLEVQYIFINNASHAVAQAHKHTHTDAHYLLRAVLVFIPLATEVCEISPGKAQPHRGPTVTQIHFLNCSEARADARSCR